MIDLDHFESAALPIDLTRQAGSSARQDRGAADPDVVLLAAHWRQKRAGGKSGATSAAELQPPAEVR